MTRKKAGEKGALSLRGKDAWRAKLGIPPWQAASAPRWPAGAAERQAKGLEAWRAAAARSEALERELAQQRARVAELERELERERSARRKAEDRAESRAVSEAERIRERVKDATRRKAERERAERVQRFSPIADLAARRMRDWLYQIGEGPEVSANRDASVDGYVVVPWQGSVDDSLMMIGETLEKLPADYWFSIIVGFGVPEDRKVKLRLRRSDIEAAPYRRATYWRRASASHINSAILRMVKDIVPSHEEMGSRAIDVAIAIHWNPDNTQPNRYQEGMDHADSVHRTAKGS